jgi:antitoxin (DNA-binding transcriptional repressor) of toxin-antitoxin stability system
MGASLVKVSMADVNKKGNTIINEVVSTGEVAIVVKHGKPIAEIRPIAQDGASAEAISYLTGLTPLKVSESVDDVLQEGRKRGI